MVKLMEILFEKDEYFKNEYKALIGFAYRLRELSEIIGNIDSIWKSRTRIREKRPLIVENYGNNNCKFIFLTTKNYSKIQINIKKFCVVEENKICNLSDKDSFLFKYRGKFVFYLPKPVLKRFIYLCGGCKESIEKFLTR
ncbi:MAG: hypothetical protein PWQ85_604 [Geotoga sp.]|jgi:hypothetical protein|nr:hypothetical protein [Geotoga sp.]